MPFSKQKRNAPHELCVLAAVEPRGVDTYCAFPVTVKWARRLRCQQSSVDCVQTGTSLP